MYKHIGACIRTGYFHNSLKLNRPRLPLFAANLLVGGRVFLRQFRISMSPRMAELHRYLTQAKCYELIQTPICPCEVAESERLELSQPSYRSQD